MHHYIPALLFCFSGSLSGGGQVTLGAYTEWMCEENTPALQSGWCSPDVVTAHQRFQCLVGDNPPRSSFVL